ncbi:MAG: SGNH/GDSL hydrolase family protein, partial [Candidatus Poseidoniales archaeon]
MRKAVFFLILMILLQSATGLVQAEGRAASTSLSIAKYDWLSNETVIISVAITNAPYSVDLFAHWNLLDENDAVILNGTYQFQASGTVTSFDFPLKHFYNGSHFYRFDVEIIDASNNIINSEQQPFMVFENAQFPPISNLLAFGDSLSDMGNGYNSILNVPDVPPYWQGRFSNGRVWLEYMSDSYGVTTTIGSGTAAGDNRAFGGSQTGQGFSYLLLPNVGTQINNYLSNVQTTIPSDAVVSLWSGGNDFLYGTANANTIVANMESHIRQLEAAGADEFLLPNLPPLEMTPEVMSRTQNQQNNIATEVVLYNQKLDGLASNLTAELGITIHYIDAWSIFNDILQNKEALGLTNVHDAACSGGVSLLPLPICSNGDTVVANVDEYLFFDKAHPTRVMHRFIGRYATEGIGEPDTDGDGIINIYDTCSWTASGASTNLTGCSWEQQDDDQDGVDNLLDLCPSTPFGSTVDAVGCSAEQRDSDNDGLNDSVDPCPFSQSSFDFDDDGCSDEVDLDDDNDGVEDSIDNCPKGLIGVHDADLDGDGCHDSEDLDLDGDGLTNAEEDAIGTDKR